MTTMKNCISNTFREVTYNNTKKERAAHTVHSTKRPKMISAPWNAQRGYTSLIFVLFFLLYFEDKSMRCDHLRAALATLKRPRYFRKLIPSENQ